MISGELICGYNAYLYPLLKVKLWRTIGHEEASLPVKFVGLGQRDTTNLCYSSFLTSIADLFSIIIATSIFSISSDKSVIEAFEACQSMTQWDILDLADRKVEQFA